MASDAALQPLDVSFARAADGVMTIRLAGVWQLESGIASATDAIKRELGGGPKPSRIAFDTAELGHWDSALVTLLATIEEFGHAQRIPIDRDRLPAGARRLLDLADANPDRPSQPAPVRLGLFAKAGAGAISANQTLG